MSLRLAPGDLLAAHPQLEDPNFARAVVLVCEHTEAGAFGLVLNRSTGLTLDQLLADHPTLGDQEVDVLLGGPVDHTHLHFVHCVPGRIQGGTALRPGLWFGGDVEAFGRYLAERGTGGGPVDEVRAFVGYAGWDEGQLDAELESGSWLPARGRDEWIFCAPGDQVWHDVVAHTLEGTSDEPPEPHEVN